MSLFTIGRLCLKIAGRDSGNKCVVVEELGNGYVLIDGNVRRKKVNIKHLEPLNEVLNIREKAPHSEVKAVFEKMGLPVWEKKSKKAVSRPVKQKKRKEKPVAEKKPAKAEKPAKKEAKVKEETA